MPQDSRQGLDIHSVGQGVRGECVSEIVEAYPLASGMVQNPMQPLMHHRGTQGHILFLRRWEQPSGIYSGSVFPEYIYDLRREEQGADSGFRFRLGNDDLRAYDSRLLVDPQFPGVQIQVIPLQCCQFSQPESCRKFQKE